MGNIEHWRIAVADPERFGGDPRARWLSPGDELREDWGEVEYVPASQLAGAVEAVEIADALAIAVLNGSADAKIIAEGYRAARIDAAIGGQ